MDSRFPALSQKLGAQVQVSRALENPFDQNKASDFSDSEILEQWVDYADTPDGLLKILQPRLRMPMLLLGGKGSGKTHLMRYCSAPVQAKRHDGSLRTAATTDGYLGIYVRAEGLNTDKFALRGNDSKVWLKIFSMYFELWLATVLVGTLRDYIRNSPLEFSEKDFAIRVADLFDVDLRDDFDSLDTLLDYLTKSRRNIDFATNNFHLSGELKGLSITFSPGKLVFGIPSLVADMIPELREVLFVYLIDEIENLTADQQRFLNSLIRYRSGNATIKVGARLYGIKTYETLGSGEPIRRDAEYEHVELDAILRGEKKGYERLVTRLVAKRLQHFGVNVKEDSTDQLNDYFEILDSKNYWLAAAADLIRDPETVRTRPYFERLHIDLVSTGRADRSQADKIITTLAMPDHIYLEKASVFLFRKRWPKGGKPAIDLARSIAGQARALRENDRERSKDLAQVVSHFGSDILAQLYRDFRRNVPYTGFRTLIDLSQGIPRNLLTNLKHIYRRAQFAGEGPFAGGRISIKSQTDGVRDGATWFWEDAQPDSQGLQVREAIEALATLFRTVRFSPSPSECDLCTFSVEVDQLSPNSQTVLEIAENWSYLIRLRTPRKNKNSRRLDAMFQLSPMLAPKWEVSEHRRGSIELKADLANAIFDPDYRANLVPLFKRRVANMITSTTTSDDGPAGGLFG